MYQHQIDEKAKRLTLWVRRKRGNRKIECSGCGRKFTQAYDATERAVRDLPWSGFQTTVWVEVLRVKCPECGVKRERVLQLPSKAPYSKRFEDAVGLACEKRGSAPGGAAIRSGTKHSAGYRPAVFGAVEVGTAQPGAAAHGSGRDPPGQEGEIRDGSLESGDRGAGVVRA